MLHSLFVSILYVVFWCSVLGIVFTYFIYPALLVLYTYFKQQGQPKTVLATPGSDAGGDSDLPSVAVVLAAYNEEKDIHNRITNLLALDYPENKLTIFVGSDGSSDATNEQLAAFSTNSRIRVTIFNENRGKASVLNDLVEQTDQQILIFTDANTEFQPDNIRRLISHFTPSVGGVCGELQIYDPGHVQSDNKDSLYWRYEQFLKRQEGRLKCLPGANGANYAIRRELFIPLPTSAIVDDLLVGCEVVLAGWDFVYAPDAIAKEEQAGDVKGEFKRRVRIGTGNYQTLGWIYRRVLQHGVPFSFVFTSHKVLRWLVPHFMTLCFFSSAILAFQSKIYALLFLMQVGVYALCGVVYRTRDSFQWPGLVQILYFLVSMNLALAIGFVRYLQGNARPTWQRTAR